MDMIEHSYNPLMEQLYNQILQSKTEIEENDAFHLFKIQSFVLEIWRLVATKYHKKSQRQANEKIKKENVQHSSKQKNSQVPFKFDVTPIGVSLQYESFDFFYHSLYKHAMSNTKKFDKKIPDREFHAALQLFTGVL